MADRYRAFISYSHADEKWAVWLQRSLERYRVPGRLRASSPDLPTRLNPIFRDKEELASSTDLGDSIRTAMGRSDTLVIVCSPLAAASKWVNEEIRSFRELAPGQDILCLMVDGSPNPAANDCAFPPALLSDAHGAALPEPLAADVRPEADGKRGAFLKIAAGLLGVGIDDLKQRDQRRKLRVLTAIAIGATTISVITIGLAISAYLARQESELRRTQAEDLIEFMLVDLRNKLEPIDKLDILDAVGDQAMDYFAALGEHGSAEEVMARAMALRQIGEVRFSQGRLEPALHTFRKSRDINAALHTASPADNDVLFELGQAEFWVGHVALEQGDFEQTGRSFTRYMELSRELLAREPDNPDYQLELMYAHSNLGTHALSQSDAKTALDHFREMVTLNAQLAAADPDDLGLQFDLAESHSWLGSALLQLHRLSEAEASYQTAFDLLESLTAHDDRPRYKEELGDLARFLADIHLQQGHVADAERMLAVSRLVTDELVAHDLGNARWQRHSLRTGYRVLELASATGAQRLLEADVSRLVAGYAALHLADESNLRITVELALAERLLALLQLQDGRLPEALAGLATARGRAEPLQLRPDARKRTLRAIALIAEAQGCAYRADNQTGKARQAWEAALTVLGDEATDSLVDLAIRRQSNERLGHKGEAQRLTNILARLGFDDPRYFPANQRSEG